MLHADIAEGYKSMAICLLARTSYQVGRLIAFGPATETIVGDDEADAMLNRPEYREPCMVPETVQVRWHVPHNPRPTAAA